MDLVYLDSDILGDSYDAQLCRKRFIRYAQDHPPVLIAVLLCVIFLMINIRASSLTG